MRATHPSILACLMLALLPVLELAGQAQEETREPETEQKAAFLFNFTKFIEWPEEAFESETAPMKVGVYGEEDFADALQSLLAGKKTHGRPFTVRRLTNVEEAASCQVIFFREGETSKFDALHESIKRLPILTVGEANHFLEKGGMFNLFFEEQQLRFEVNPAMAESVKLVVSSKLLRLAKRAGNGGAK